MMLVHHDDAAREVRLWAEVEDRHILRRADGPVEEAGLGRDQHEERLEADLRVRVTSRWASAAAHTRPGSADRMMDRDELRAVGERSLDLDLVDHLGGRLP